MIEELAAAFLGGEDASNSLVGRSLAREAVRRLEEALPRIPLEVRWADRDPYGSYEELRDQTRSTGVLYVWTGASDVPLWDPLTNWKFRAVHDWIHLTEDVDFSMAGEIECFRATVREVEGLAPLYFSEIVLQAAVTNARAAFPEQQKLVLLNRGIGQRL